MINLNGYYVNEKYPDIIALIRELMNTAVIARTKMEAKTILRLLRYLGVNHLMYDSPMSEQLEINIPNRGLKNHMYQICLYKGEPIGLVMPVFQNKPALIIRPTMRVKDVVFKKSLGAMIRDLF